jgi:hypothetical protein
VTLNIQQADFGRTLRLAGGVAAIVALTACAASTQVVPIGKDTYSISHRDNGPLSSLGALKAAAYKDATAFCATKNQAVQVLRSTDVPRSFGQFPETEVQFTCVPE